jgi:hypothetical protein
VLANIEQGFERFPGDLRTANRTALQLVPDSRDDELGNLEYGLSLHNLGVDEVNEGLDVVVVIIEPRKQGADEVKHLMNGVLNLLEAAHKEVPN